MVALFVLLSVVLYVRKPRPGPGRRRWRSSRGFYGIARFALRLAAGQRRDAARPHRRAVPLPRAAPDQRLDLVPRPAAARAGRRGRHARRASRHPKRRRRPDRRSGRPKVRVAPFASRTLCVSILARSVRQPYRQPDGAGRPWRASASAPRRCWRRCASGTSGASGSRTWSRCSATGPAGSPWPCSCSSAPARPRWAAAVTAVSLAGFVGIGQVLATLADRHGRVARHAGGRLRPRRRSSPPCSCRSRSACCSCSRSSPASPPRRSRPLARPPSPTSCPRRSTATRSRWRASRCSRRSCVGYALGGLLLTRRRARGGARDQRRQLPRVGAPPPRSSATPRPPSRPRCRATVGRSLGDGAASIFRDRLVRRALVIVAVTGALGTVGEALVVPYGVEVGHARRHARPARGRRPVGTLLATAAIAGGQPRPPSAAPQRGAGAARSPRRPPRRCSGSRPAARFAFVAFAIAGGMFAVSIPTNTVIGMRLSRDTRASAMGIAVGVLMGSQALGRRARRARRQPGRARRRPSPAPLAAAAVFSLWSARRPRRTRPSTSRRPAAPCAAARSPAETVVDLVASRPSAHPPASREPGAAGVRIHRHDARTCSTIRPLLATLLATVLARRRRRLRRRRRADATGDGGTTTADGGTDR